MFDVAIVGGGLAGCAAAITLAQQNHRVILLEAGSYPRPKVCGEFLSPESVSFFSESGFLEKLKELNPVDIQTLRITAPDSSQWCAALPAPALSISRFALDKALADYVGELGVEVHAGTRVMQIDGNLNDGFFLKAQSSQEAMVFQAKAVIAAHGRHSNLDRVLTSTLPKQRSAHYIGLKQHFVGPAFPGHVDLHVFQGGYCGMSQVEDGTTNVCLLVRQDVFQEASGKNPHSIAQFISWMGEQNHHLRNWLSQSSPVYPDWLSTAQISLMTKTPVKHDILFVGDSAGMIAPLAGDGMAMALHSGKLAAVSLDCYLSHLQDAQALTQSYTRMWHHTFGARLRLGRILQSMMLRPNLLAPALRFISRYPAIGNWLVRHTRDLDLLK